MQIVFDGRRLAPTFACLLALAAPVAAQTDDDPPPPRGASADDVREFQKLDVTGNGYLTGTELDAPGVRGYDANGDKVVSRDEFLAGRARARGGKPPAPAKPGPATKPAPPARPAPARTAPARPVPTGKVEQPAPARVTARGPVGLYFMTKYWIATRSLEKAVWYFAPDGKVYKDLMTGFSAADLAAHKESRGTYRLVGKDLEVRWSDGQVSKAELEKGDVGFFWDTGNFVPARPYTAGKSIAGSYEGGESIGNGFSSAAMSKTLELKPDGTFVWSGIASFRTVTEESTVTTGGQGQATTGTWRVSGYSLILTDSQGNVLRGISFPYDDEKTPVYPDRMFFSGIMYKRL